MTFGYQVEQAEVYGASATVRTVLADVDPLRPAPLTATTDATAGHPGLARAIADLGEAMRISSEVLTRTAAAAATELSLTGDHYQEQEDKTRQLFGLPPVGRA